MLCRRAGQRHMRALWGVDWARWLVAGGVLICSASAGRGGERYWWSAWSMRALRRCASSAGPGRQTAGWP
jgi:hypothetical protein